MLLPNTIRNGHFMPRRGLIEAILISFLLSACAAPFAQTKKPVNSANQQFEMQTQTAPVATISVTNNSSTNDESIAEYLNKVLLLSSDGQKEVQDLNQALQNNKQDITLRTKLALLYGLPSSKVRDLNKAQSFTEDLLKENLITNERKTIVLILRDYIAESIKISQRMREEQRKSDVLQFKLENLQTKSDAAQQRADSLQQKLDELKNIEKTMIDRSHSNKK